MLGKAIQDLTVEFVKRWIPVRSRTNDPMVQAARSNPQNIAEGYTQESLSIYINLSGIARGSSEELGKDFEDFLRQRGLPIWPKDDQRIRVFREFRVFWIDQNALNTPKLPNDPTEAANMILTFCRMEGYLLRRHVESLKKKHEQEGGLRENLPKKRLGYRNNH